jgi:hypothetical protein
MVLAYAGRQIRIPGIGRPSHPFAFCFVATQFQSQKLEARAR